MKDLIRAAFYTVCAIVLVWALLAVFTAFGIVFALVFAIVWPFCAPFVAREFCDVKVSVTA